MKSLKSALQNRSFFLRQNIIWPDVNQVVFSNRSGAIRQTLADWRDWLTHVTYLGPYDTHRRQDSCLKYIQIILQYKFREECCPINAVPLNPRNEHTSCYIALSKNICAVHQHNKGQQIQFNITDIAVNSSAVGIRTVNDPRFNRNAGIHPL